MAWLDTMRPLNFLLLAGFLAKAYSLECFKCDSGSNCTQRIERCQEGQNWCTTLLHQYGTVNDTQKFILKGCAWREGANRTILFPSGMAHTEQSEYFCDTNLCNREDPVGGSVSVEPNGFQCHACPHPVATCNKTYITVENCTGLANKCLSSYTTIFFGEDRFTKKRNYIFGGCIYNPSCTAPLGYHTEKSSTMYDCCNSSLCNDAISGFTNKTQTSNGVKCFSYEKNVASGSTPQNETAIDCFGLMSMCMSAKLNNERRNMTVAIKGCATPAWCRQPFHPEFQIADFQEVRCCQGSLCNGQEVNATTPATSSSAASTQTTFYSKQRYTIHSDGGLAVAAIHQFTTGLLLISTSWNLMTFSGF